MYSLQNMNDFALLVVYSQFRSQDSTNHHVAKVMTASHGLCMATWLCLNFWTVIKDLTEHKFYLLQINGLLCCQLNKETIMTGFGFGLEVCGRKKKQKAAWKRRDFNKIRRC